MPEQQAVEVTDISVPGPWSAVDLEAIRRQFRDFLHSSQFPEKFRGVARGAEPPGEEGSWHVVDRDFSIDPKRRDGTRVPCAFCRVDSKWTSSGVLVISNGWLFLIGPRCGKNYLVGWEQRLRAYSRKVDVRRAEAFLLELAPRAPELLAFAIAILPYAEEASTAHRALQKPVKLARALREAIHKKEGWLTVDVMRTVYLPVPGGRPIARKEPRPENVSRITGEPAVSASCRLGPRAASVVASLCSLCKSEEAMLERILEAHDTDNLLEVEATIRDACRELVEVRLAILGFAAFVQEANYLAIKTWTARVESPCWGYRVSWNGARRLVVPTRGANQDFSVPLLAAGKIPESPSWLA